MSERNQPHPKRESASPLSLSGSALNLSDDEIFSSTEEFAHCVFESSTNGFFEWFAPDDRFRYSSSFERMLGYDRGELPLNEPTVTCHIYKDDFPNLQKLFSKSALLGEGFDTRFRMYNKYGELRWFQVHVSVISKTHSGCVKNAIGSVADIHDVKIAQEESHRRAETENWLSRTVRELLAQDSNQAIDQSLSSVCEYFDIDYCSLRHVREQNSNFHLVNVGQHPRLDGKFKVSRELSSDQLPFDLNLLLSGKSHIINDVDHEASQSIEAAKTLRRKNIKSFAIIPIYYRGQLDYSLSLLRVDRPRPWSVESLRAAEVIGDTAALMAARQSITRVLSNSETRFQHALDATQDGIWDWDLANNHFYVTPTFLYMLGYDEEFLPITEEKLNSLLFKPTTIRDFFRYEGTDNSGTRGCFEIELPMHHLDGHTVWVLVRAKYVAWNNEGKPIRCVGENKNISAYKEVLSRSINEKRNLLRDYNSAVKLLSQTRSQLADALDSLEPTPNEKLPALKQHLASVYNELESFEKQRGNLSPSDTSSIDLQEVFIRLKNRLEDDLISNNLDFTIDVSKKIPASLFGDAENTEDLFDSLLQILVSTSQNDRLNLHVSLLQQETTDCLILFSFQRVKPIDNFSVFDACFDKIIHMDGDFSHSSSLVHGARISFALSFNNSASQPLHSDGEFSETPKNVSEVKGIPLAESTVDSNASQTIPQNQDSDENNLDAKLSTANILLVEDNPINQQVAVGMLKRKGVSVTIVNNGREAIDTLIANPPHCYDLILMDMEMPVLDGYEATKTIRDIAPIADIPIIALTAHAMKQDKYNCLEAGMNDHIPKPVKPDILYSTIAKHLKVSPSQPS